MASMESAEQEADRVKGGAEISSSRLLVWPFLLHKKLELLKWIKRQLRSLRMRRMPKIKALEDEAAALTGKDNKKARTEKSKEASALKTTPEYIDATRILKDQEPKNGNFVKSKAAPKAAAAPVAAAAEEPAKEDDKKGTKDKPKKLKEG